MGDEDKRKLLLGHWVHSHEEDSETDQVFRPADYAFPPSRGRTGFQLNPDGSLVKIGPGPTDSPQAQRGQWELTAEDSLVLRVESTSEASQSKQIRSLEKDKLVLKKKTACDPQ